jgi:hypothetical protein
VATLNIELLERALARFRENPDRLDMKVGVAEGTRGLRTCLAGEIYILDFEDMYGKPFYFSWNQEDQDDCEYIKGKCYRRLKWNHVKRNVMGLLGIEIRQADPLFLVTCWPTELKVAYREAGNACERLGVLERRVGRFLEEYPG